MRRKREQNVKANQRKFQFSRSHLSQIWDKILSEMPPESPLSLTLFDLPLPFLKRPQEPSRKQPKVKRRSAKDLSQQRARAASSPKEHKAAPPPRPRKPPVSCFFPARRWSRRRHALAEGLVFTEAREGLWLALRRPAHTWLLHRSRDLAFSVLAIARERVLGRGGSPGGNGGRGMQVYGNEVRMW